MHQNKNQNNIHIPVLMQQVLQYLDPSPGKTYLDLTAGYGGHASEVLERTLTAPAVLVDRDINAVNHLNSLFNHQENVVIKHGTFLEASRELATAGKQFDLILADVGVSSPHLNIPSRGFAIAQDGPLDMRMDQSQELTADILVNKASAAELVDIFRRYGEEPKAEKIVRSIFLHRPIHSTVELADVVARAVRQKDGKGKKPLVHPATRVFQALRIAVNDELAQLEQSLALWAHELLAPGGHLVVISFHSLEDRLVKQAFNEAGGNTYDASLTILTKHPVVAEPNEIVFNPRSRSAKLRAAVKNKKQKEGGR